MACRIKPHRYGRCLAVVAGRLPRQIRLHALEPLLGVVFAVMQDHRGDQRDVIDVLSGADADLATPFWIGEIFVSDVVELHPILRRIDDAGTAGESEPLSVFVAISFRNCPFEFRIVNRLSDSGIDSLRKIADIDGQWWSSLFVHRGALYLIGTSRQDGFVVIRRSDNGGRTWTTPRDRNSGLLLNDAKYHCAPVPVIEHEGRIWRAMEDTNAGGGWGKHFRAFMMSAPADADLVKASSWTSSNAIARVPEWLGGDFGGWLEGNAVVTPEGRIVDVLRVDVTREEKAAIIEISADGKVASFDPARLPPARVPRIVLGPPAMWPHLQATGAQDDSVFVAVATPGLNAAGHLLRTDGSIVVPLVAARDDGLPTVDDVLTRLLALLMEQAEVVP